MKFLFFTTLYSHFVPLVKADKWEPMGMPAFYKLLEAVNAEGIEADVLMGAPKEMDGLDGVVEKRFDELKNIVFHFLPRKKSGNFGTFLNRTGIADVDISHMSFFKGLLKRNNYDLVYCDKGHVAYAAYAARRGFNACLRLFGVDKFNEDVMPFRGRFGKPSLQYFSFRAPFSYVICSRDGSPGENFIRKVMKDVPYEVILNGIDPIDFSNVEALRLREEYKIPASSKIILATGRLDPEKGIDKLVRALGSLNRINKNFFTVIVGDGSLRDELEKISRDEDFADRIIFTGQVPHRKIHGFLKEADIYVSLNQMGNFSNAMLEAMYAGRCIVSLKKCRRTGRDDQTEMPELAEAMVLIDRENIAEELPAALNSLISDPALIKDKEEKIKAFADSFLKTWDDRMKYEMELLKKLVSEERS